MSTYCDNPYTKEGETISFPCGQCLPCRKRRASSWGFRLQEQLKVSDTAYFITLTYDPKHVPKSPIKKRLTLSTPIKKNGAQKGKSSDTQIFLKRIRRKQPPQIVIGQKKIGKKLVNIYQDSISYYLAAEYGGRTMRPHYHLVIFNLQLTTLLETQVARRALLVPHMYLDGKYHFHSPLWPKGHLTIGTVTHASAMYSLKYLSKPKQVPQYKGDDRTPEYSLISKGLGESYLSNQVKQWHRNDPNERMYVNFQNYKIAMPRYYKERIYSQEERLQIAETIVAKQKEKRIQERKGTKLVERIKYINKMTQIRQNNNRILKQKSQFRPQVL